MTDTSTTIDPAIVLPENAIRIHTSDRATFKRCRRRWDWSSPLRQNLRPKIGYFGISFPLWFGTMVHRALEFHYNPTLKRDPLEVFQTEYHTSLGNFRREAQDFVDENADKFQEHYDMGVSMLTFYKDYAERMDNFDVVAAEKEFAVLIGSVVEGEFHADDASGQPVYYCGRMDAVVQDRDTGRYGIIDHKTAAAFSDGYFDKLDMDEQCTSYMWAAQEFAREHELPYTQIDFVYYNVLRKCTIKPPTITSRGRLSIDRQHESCTADMFMEAVRANNLAWQLEDPKTAAYLDWLSEAGDTLFVQRANVRRNQHEVAALADRVKLEVADMVRASIYPNPSGDWYCVYCPFRSPCLAANDGSDYRAMLEANYATNMVAGRYTSY